MSNNLSNSIDNWLLNYKDAFDHQEAQTQGPTINVSDAAGKLAFIYEKIRNTVDYKEDHLLRKHAIARTIKRIATPGSRGSDIALPLIEELIRARYLPNKTVPESIVDQVRQVINKYVVVYNSAIDKNYPPKELRNFFSWLINLAACEVEEILVPDTQDKISIDAMHRVVRQNIILDGQTDLDSTAQNIQIYIAVLKALIKADEMTVNYFLVKYYFSDWRNLSLAQAADIALQVKNSQSLIRQHYYHPLNERLTREFKKYAVTFWILQDIIQANPRNFISIFQNREDLVEKIRDVCKTKYSQIGARVRRSIIRSIIYIFLTKMVFGLLLELPYDYFILNDLQWLSLSINALFPPMLMAAIGMSIRTPKKDNTDQIIEEVDSIVYSHKGQEHCIRIIKPKKGFFYYLMQFIYAILCFVSFGLIIYGLAQLLFSIPSMIIFLFFLTMISFFSLRIRRTAAELIIIERRERLLTALITLFFVPVLRVGRWISIHSSKINVFIFTLDFIIETPFKIFVRIFEDLIIFVKEKKDEML
jgi:hypothetical protein